MGTTTIRPFKYDDLHKLHQCNMDPLVETYDISYYTNYLNRWPEMCWVVEAEPDQMIVGYILGKNESSPRGTFQGSENYLPWHGHITALTVAAEYRHQGLAMALSRRLEEEAERQDAWFVDLYVRASNQPAIGMYRKMGYSVYRRVVAYYGDEVHSLESLEDAFDMRKACKRDTAKKYVRERGEDYKVNPEDVW